MNDLAGFLEHIKKNHVTRADGIQLIGADEIKRLIGEGVIVESPWTKRLEAARPTEDWYP